MDRPRKRTFIACDCWNNQRILGPLGQDGEEAGVETNSRHDT